MITVISTLPPAKGLSAYTLGFVKSLSRLEDIDFIGFKKLYPNFLYPGGSIDPHASTPVLPSNIHIRNILTWYNPISWLQAAFSIKTKVVHAQWWSWFLAPAFITILAISRLRGKKIIITVHNVLPHEKFFFKVLANHAVLGLASEYVVHNEDNKKLFLSKNKTKKPVHVIPHGIIEFPKSPISNGLLRQKYGYADDDKIILFFGNIRDYKGLSVLLDTLPLLDKNSKLIVAGKPWSTFDPYQQQINRLGIQSRVQTFLDFVPDAQVAEIFKITDLVVYPYLEFEASSGAATVALDFGKAVVVTSVGGLPDVVIDKNVVATPGDSVDLCRKIAYALKHLNPLSTESVKIAQQMSWNNIIKKYQSIY